MGADLAVYVTGHGFGHATRTRAWLAALRARGGADLRIHVRCEAPHRKLSPERLDLECSSAPIDVGMLQPNGLDLDLEASLEAHRAFLAGWDAALEREAAWIADLGARLVVGDVPPLAFAAARRAGVPSLAVTNFSWDWVVAEHAATDPRWQPIVDAYRKAYGEATLLLRLPLSDGLTAFRESVDVPLLVNVSARSRAECRQAIGVVPDEARRVVLVSFGGFGGVSAEAEEDEDLSAYLFVCSDDPPRRRDSEWVRVETSDALPHEDVVHACDALIGKPGYGTVSEALAHGTRYLWLPRPGFCEAAPLVEGLERHGCALPMPREDFAAGRWRPHLDALFALPQRPARIRTDGAAVIADTLLERLAA